MKIEKYLEEKTKSREKDSYSMSIRELSNMYEAKLVNLSPVYQRKFRWDEFKASKLIESIFIGIPIPPIFISVRDGNWDIIDGVQRISSILWFLGKLKDTTEKDKVRSFLKLKGLEELELLNENTYEELSKNDFSSVFKYFEMRRLDIVLLTSNDIESEYQLFSRLNTGGITLSAQEIRNFFMIKINPDFYNELLSFQKNTSLLKVLSVSKKQVEEDYIMELLVYFIIISKSETLITKDEKKRKAINLYKEYKTKYSLSRDRFIDKSIGIILNEKIVIESEINNMKKIFSELDKSLKEKPFMKGSKFSPFLYICLISYICNSKTHCHTYSVALEKILENELYIQKASRGTNVVDQFISGIEIGCAI